MFPKLGPAFERKLNELNADWAKATSELLKKVIGEDIALTVACNNQQMAAGKEYVAVQEFFSNQDEGVLKQLDEWLENAKELHERLARMNISTRGYPLDQGLIEVIRGLPGDQLSATEILLQSSAFMSNIVTETMRILLLDLEALLKETDDAALEAAIRAIENGVIDHAIDVIFPGFGGLLTTLLRAIKDFRDAHRQRLMSADKYLASAEKYNAACNQWLDVMQRYVASLKEFRERKWHNP
jgi:hypothetical protein